jgi:hypothetical protein
MDDVDDTAARLKAGRRDMIEAFGIISTIARRAGVITEEEVLALHGQFFNGNVAIKEAFNVAAILARIRHDPI